MDGEIHPVVLSKAQVREFAAQMVECARRGHHWEAGVRRKLLGYATHLEGRVVELEAEVARLRAANEALAGSCREMVDAMDRYEMDCDSAPPRDHVSMMERAHAALAANDAISGAREGRP